MKKIGLNLLALFLFVNATSTAQSELGIIPKPNSVVLGTDSFHLKSGAKINMDTKVKNAQIAANFFIAKIAKPTGFKLTAEKTQEPDSKGDINIQFDKTLATEEAYNLVIDKNRITIKAKTGAGAFYALQTLLQLMPPTIYGDKKIINAEWKIPTVSVNDAPGFKYRGVHLDCGRHVFTIEFIKRYIDLMAMHKMNTFHWHLTEDQGWRIEIKKYPKLTTVGAFRKETCTADGSSPDLVCDGMRYGGFYSQVQIKEIVKYASDRFITIIPEIEMPGHSLAALAAYPWLACKDSAYQVGTKWGVFDDVMCPTEKTMTFVQDVLTEVMAMFPGKLIHIGGDEVPKVRWKESAACQQIITKEKLKDEAELQSWFNKQVEKFLNSRGRQLIGWDEILEGGLSPNATVMSWRGEDGGIAAAKSGHDAVMTPGNYCYFDHYQSLAKGEPIAIGGFTTVEKVYSFNPIPAALNETEAKHILGAQANVWTEYIERPAHVEYMLYPRLCALSEVVWSSKENKDYTDFLNRLMVHFKRLDVMKVNYAKHTVDVSGVVKPGNSGMPEVTLTSRVQGAQIFYTTDGSIVTKNSNAYAAPFEVKQKTTIKAAAFKDTIKLGNEYSQTVNVHKAVGKSVKLINPPASIYNPGSSDFIINGIEGSINYGDGQWFGFSGTDLDANIDLGEPQTITKVKLNFNIKNDSWIYSPKSVAVFSSDDGVNYNQIAIDTTELKNRISTVTLNFAESNIRYLKVVAVNAGIIPDGKPGGGNPAWLFVDEIVVE